MTFQPSAVERAAAAQVLSGERSRFKRVVSKRLGGVGDGSIAEKKKKKKKKKRKTEEDGEQEPGEEDGLPLEGVDAGMEGGAKREAKRPAFDEREQQQQQQQQQQQPVLISVGGFKAVDHSVAVTREVADFCRVVAGVKRAAEAAAAGAAAGYGGAAAAGGVEEEGAGSALARAGLFEPAFLLILHSLEVRLLV